MRAITVDKDALIQALTKNMADHRTVYEAAMRAYEEKVREWFEVNLNHVKAGRWAYVKRTCPWPVPEEHTDDYQRALDMLGWDLGNTYELTETDFDQYVNDNWGWARSFMANSASYLVTESHENG